MEEGGYRADSALACPSRLLFPEAAGGLVALWGAVAAPQGLESTAKCEGPPRTPVGRPLTAQASLPPPAAGVHPRGSLSHTTPASPLLPVAAPAHADTHGALGARGGGDGGTEPRGPTISQEENLTPTPGTFVWLQVE